MNDANMTTLAILAGGEGSRMGMPKGLLRIGDQPILVYLFDRFAWNGPTMLVTAPGREHPPGADRFDREVTDPISAQGPLRGLATALEHATTPLLVVTTVDMPAIESSQLHWLIEQMIARPRLAGLMNRRVVDGTDHIEPFPSVYHPGLALRHVIEELVQNRRSVHGLTRTGIFEAIAVPGEWSERIWLNLNEPVDLDHLRSGDEAISRSDVPPGGAGG